jgi:hypothetical protein
MRRKMNGTIREQRIDTVFVLIIFCVFAISMLLVLMFGASIYKNMTEISREGYDECTTLSYFWTKVKNCDDAGKVYIGDFQGQPALCLAEVFGDTTYLTMIYRYRGRLYELFTEMGIELDPEDGMPIIDVGDLEFYELDDGLIKITAGAKSVLIAPRGGFVE